MISTVLLSISLLLHPFYVSVTEAKYNKEARTLECSVRIFTDDLERALKDRGYGVLNLDSEEESAQADSLIGHYVLSTFTVVTDKGKRRLVYVGREYEEDGTYVHFQAEAISTRFKWVEMHTSLLVEQFEDQRNIIHVTKGASTHSLLLNAKERGGTVEFQE